MSDLLDDVEIPIECDCGHETEKTIGWIKTHDHFVCSACGTTLRFDPNQFKGELGKVDRKLDALDETIKNLNKRK